MTWAKALAAATRVLGEAGVTEPGRDARLLLASVLDCEPGRLALHLQEQPGERAECAFGDLVTERSSRVPMSHILGHREFYRHRFEVTSDTLDPRPETELLVELALSRQFGRVLDLGTGTGAILLSLLAACPDAQGVGADISAAALEVAARNANALCLDDRVALIRSNWFAGISGSFDLIVSNPPYIALDEMGGLAPEVLHEPTLALTDGGDGLSAYRAIAAGAAAHLAQNGRLLVEIGATQAADVSAIFRGAGFDIAGIHADLGGRDRVIFASNGDFQ